MSYDLWEDLHEERQRGYYDASEAAPWEGPAEPYPPEEPWDSTSDAGSDHAPAVHDH